MKRVHEAVYRDLHFNVCDADFVYEDGTFIPVCVLHAFLHHVRCKFMLRQRQNFSSHGRHDPGFVFLQKKCFQMKIYLHQPRRSLNIYNNTSSALREKGGKGQRSGPLWPVYELSLAIVHPISARWVKKQIEN